jgi:hypothetical protein
MWRSGIISLVVVALSMCVTAAEQPTQVTPGDIAIMAVEAPGGLALQSAADPNQTWDPAAHLAGSWTSVTLTSRTDRNSDVPARSLAVASSFTITDPNGLLGLTQSPTGILALDQNAKVFYSSTVGRDRFYMPPMSIKTMKAGQWVSELQPYTFSVSMPLDPNCACPLMLTKLQWSTYALVAGTVKNVDLPFKVSDKWVDVATGLQVLVEKADITGTSYQYSIKVKYTPSKVSMSSGSVLLVGDQKPPEVIVTKVDVLNTQGKSIPDQASGGFSSGSSYTGSGDTMTGTSTGSGNCNICGTAATIRYTVTLNAYEKEIRFLLQNVPVPALWY